VNNSRLLLGMTAVFAGLAALMVVLAAVFRDAVPLFVAAAFGGASYLFWYQGSGKLRASLYERVERRARANSGRERRGRDAGGRGRRGDRRQGGGFGAGPREDWTPPGGRERWEYRYQQQQRGPGGSRGRAGARVAARDGPTDGEAYATLGLEPGADETDVKQAYRRLVKETHPDTDDGDEEAFKEVTEAYEHLTD
jgi:DnaJ-domain-containing protein 1